jgi:serine protease SohB
MGVYHFFCKHVVANRPSLSSKIDEIATGEHWHGLEALEIGLVDEIKTSEEFILENLRHSEFIKVAYVGERKTLAERFGAGIAQTFAEGLVKAFYNTLSNTVIGNKYF